MDHESIKVEKHGFRETFFRKIPQRNNKVASDFAKQISVHMS